MPGTAALRRDGAVATITLDHPGRMNAFDKPMWRALDAAIREAAADGSLRAVVLTGAGNAFSPGADIAEFETERATPEQARDYGVLMNDVMARLAHCPHPTVAAIEGTCCGIALAVALCCDLRICSESSRFGVPAARLGIAMSAPELALLHAAVGPSAAKEILLEARLFGADTALRMGVVNRVTPNDGVAAEVAATAARIAEGAPLAARWNKRLIHRLSQPEPLTEAEIADSYACFGTADYREGYRAFLEKRKPAFRGE